MSKKVPPEIQAAIAKANEEAQKYTDRIVTDQIYLKQMSKLTFMAEVERLELEPRIRAASMKAWTPGYGLAAIQIGVPLRYAHYAIPDHKRKGMFLPRHLVNPKIVHMRQAVIGKEGCLSIPGRWVNTQRYQIIFYTNDAPAHDQKMVRLLDGEPVYCAMGLEALIIQHEVDHMNGILITQREWKPKADQGRNEKCACGSGKKYKKCCMDKPVEVEPIKEDK